MSHNKFVSQFMSVPKALRIAKEYEDLIIVDRYCFDGDLKKREMIFAIITLMRSINADREFINRDDVKWGIYSELRAKVVAKKRREQEQNRIKNIKKEL